MRASKGPCFQPLPTSATRAQVNERHLVARLLTCAEFLRPERRAAVALEGLVRVVADPEFAETRSKDVLAVAGGMEP